jgi:hypothetical protein
MAEPLLDLKVLCEVVIRRPLAVGGDGAVVT